MLMLGKHAFVCAYMHLAALVDQKKDVIERLLKKVAKLPDNAKQFIFELVPEVGRLQNEHVKQLARQSIEMQGYFYEKRIMIGSTLPLFSKQQVLLQMNQLRCRTRRSASICL